jgi:predicted nucleic acid-binding protein
MRYLLDTNILSQTAKTDLDQAYADWARLQRPDELAVSAMTFGEVRKGIELLPNGRRRAALEQWLARAIQREFRGRVLRVNTRVALEWGRLLAAGRKQGRPLDPIDGILLATAVVYNLVLVTRNERDFAGRGVPIINPWSDSASD